jgi:hypothetical protein
MKKKILAIILTIAIIIGAIPIISLADGNTSYYGGNSQYIYEMTADEDTGSLTEAELENLGFGNRDNDGMVWTDKSVTPDGGGFNVTLRALSQEYVSSVSSVSYKPAPAADVVFVLDFTGSMTNSNINNDDGTTYGTRLKALVDATNEAIDVIVHANKYNRIAVYVFGGGNGRKSMTVANLLPINYYWNSKDGSTYSTSTTEASTDKYLIYNSNNNSVSTSTYLQTRSTADATPTSYTQTTQSTITGTCTQYGIANSISQFISAADLGNMSKDRERKPFVIMMTDGEATTASNNWNTDTASDLSSNTTTTTCQLEAYTILTAAYWKDKLQDAYDSFNYPNGKTENDTDDLSVQWFNIGLGVTESATDATSCLINPELLKGIKSSSSGTDNQKIKYYLEQYAKNYTTKDYYTNDAYIYPSSGDGYVQFANTYEVLMKAFQTLAKIIKDDSNDYFRPIVTEEKGTGSSESASSEKGITFTDVIGEGMYVDPAKITLTPDGESPITGTYNAETGVCTFSGYKTTVTITENDGQQTLVWFLPTTEVAMFTMIDRDSIAELKASAMKPADPTALTYKVYVKDGSAINDYVYTNAFDSSKTPLTTVEYDITYDNPYYYDVTTGALTVEGSDTAVQIYKSSKPKAEYLNQTITTNKTENTTSSSDILSSYFYSYNGDPNADSSGSGLNDDEVGTGSSTTCKGVLGNNGRAIALVKITKTVDKYQIPGTSRTITGDATYTTNVKNLTKGDITYSVNDKIYTTTSASDVNTYTGTLASGENKDHSTTSSLSGSNDDIIPGYAPKITTLNGATVNYDSGEYERKEGYNYQDKYNLDVLLTQNPSYHITYDWGEDAPSSEKLPVDSTNYSSGASYTVDSTYTNGTKITTDDGVYEFSGWTAYDSDGNVYTGSTITSDITMKGTWTKTSIYSIKYNFTGDVPDNTTAPTDSNAYAAGANYTIDSSFTKDKVITVNDVNYKFSGWTVTGATSGKSYNTESLDGTMPDENLVATGNWVRDYKVVYKYEGDAPSEDLAPLPKTERHYAGDSVLINDYTTVTDTKNNCIWTFVEWENFVPVMPSSDLTIVGKWTKANTYSITYNFTGDVPAGTTAPKDANAYTAGDSYTIDSSFTKDKVITVNGVNYKFSGWTVTGPTSGKSYNTDSLEGTMPGENLEATGDWVRDYEISYSFSGDAPTKAPASERHYPNESVTTPTYEDVVDATNNCRWVFNGWNDTITSMPSNDVARVGTWEKQDAQSVTYEFTGIVPEDKTAPGSQTVIPGEKYIVDTTFKEGDTVNTYDDYGNITGTYTFEGWNDPNNGVMDTDGVTITGNWTYTAVEVTKHQVTVPDVYPDNPDKPNGETFDVTNNSYIIVDPNGGEWEYNGTTYDKSTKVTITDDITINDPTKENHTFLGWEISENKDGIKTLTAQYDINDRTITYKPEGATDDNPTKDDTVKKNTVIKVDPNNGVWTHGNTPYDKITSITVDKNTTLEDPTREGFTFTGWKVETDKDGNITYVAQWRKNEYTVTYPEYPTDTEGEGEGDKTPEEKKTDIKNGSTITVNPNGGEWKYGDDTYTDTTNIKVDGDIDLGTPERDGYDFKGWKVETDDKGNTTFTAQWEKSKLTIDDVIVPATAVIVPAAVIGGVTGAIITGGVTAAIVAGSVIGAVPVAVVGAVAVKKIVDKVEAQDNNNSDNDSNNNGNDAGEEIPYTGSNTTLAIVLAAIIVLAAGIIVVTVVSKKKKTK